MITEQVIAKQLLLEHDCMHCGWHDWYYPMGDTNQKIHMCDNPVRAIGVPGLTDNFQDLDKRGTCEEWAL